MSKIQLVCPSMYKFIQTTAEYYRDSTEMKAYSVETLNKIDEVIRKAAREDYSNWRFGLALFSKTTEWYGSQLDLHQYPLCMKNTTGKLGTDLMHVLPDKTLGDITAVYVCMRLLLLNGEEDEDTFMMFDNFVDNETIATENDRIVFTLSILEDSMEPVPVSNFDPIKMSTQKAILEDIYPFMNKEYHTQYY